MESIRKNWKSIKIADTTQKKENGIELFDKSRFILCKIDVFRDQNKLDTVHYALSNIPLFGFNEEQHRDVLHNITLQ